MSTSVTPLFFAQALKSPELWDSLGKTHELTRKDFEWFKHITLASQTLRSQQSPPMVAETILLTTNDRQPVPLVGSFVLSATPDGKGAILYTPYGGIKKFSSRSALNEQLGTQLKSATKDDELLALISLAERKTLADAADIKVTFEAIDGDVFKDQRRNIIEHQHLNEQLMIAELKALPTLSSLLNAVLNDLLKGTFPGLDQSQTQVGFYLQAQSASRRRWMNFMTLSDALLLYFRQQRWPFGQSHEFSHPAQQPTPTNQTSWETAVTTASRKLISLLCRKIEGYWNAVSVDGVPRSEFFSNAIAEKARADLLLKREAGIITPQQWQDLHSLIKPTSRTYETLTVEVLRLWEYRANYVELAGSLMVSAGKVFLYTPTHGLQVFTGYRNLKDSLQSKDSTPGHDDELYGLLSLEERQRFIGFDQADIEGKVISGSIFEKLFDAIIAKQLHNIEYALQVFRQSDGVVDIRALFDKALDIRTMITEHLLTRDTNGRWSTRPVLSGNQQPSMVLAETAVALVKTFNNIEKLINVEFAAQPVTSLALQRVYLENMKPMLSHALSVGIRGEANARRLNTTLRVTDQAIVDTVLNPDQPDRKNRLALNGFRPDVYSLTLEHDGHPDLLPLAHCMLLTERGGLDTRHSGRAILWTPAQGLEVFENVSHVRQTLNLRLLDSQKCLALLENLTPTQRAFHRRYALGPFRLIEDHVLQRLSQSSIEQFLGRCEYLRTLETDNAKQNKLVKTLTNTAINTNLPRAALISQAISRQQSLPAWLGMSPIEDLQLHVELLEQYRNSSIDGKDYLHGIKTLQTYVHETLKSLLDSRFKETLTDPDTITITPKLALAGPAQSLTEYALNPVNGTWGTGFKVDSTTAVALPEGLDEAAVRQQLLSLSIAKDYAKLVTDSLSSGAAGADERMLRFIRQLPWQLMQHAHEQKLQERISENGFDLIRQVLDMPDAIARTAVKGANAMVRPVELIKTAGAASVKTLGLYLIGPGSGQPGPQVLYAPYLDGSPLREFENEASVVSAFNTPGALQELLIRRLPETERSGFRNLFKTTVGEQSEITLASSAISGNLLTRLYKDNLTLLEQMLSSQYNAKSHPDWEAVKNLFSSGISRISGLLPAKLAYVPLLWQAYKDFKDSAEGLQDHHWQQALQDFIAGAAQMVTLGWAMREAQNETVKPMTGSPARPAAAPVTAVQWSQVQSTAAIRTSLQPFENTGVELKDLTHNSADGTYLDATTKHTYAPVAGKVYQVNGAGTVWQVIKGQDQGSALLLTADKQLVLDPDTHIIHYGKALSKNQKRWQTTRTVRTLLNVVARGMEDIRAKHPEKARMIVESIDMARFYAFNSLHNLVQLKKLIPGTRLEIFLKRFFDVDTVDSGLLDKIKEAIVPVCNALVDPEDDLLNAKRFVVGSAKHPKPNLIAFVLDKDPQKIVHFTEGFFDQHLEMYNACLTEPFNINGHARAATLLHELAHQVCDAVDIAPLEARRPFLDLVLPTTPDEIETKEYQTFMQRNTLSLATPKEELFARWNSTQQSWVDLDQTPHEQHVGKAILKITNSKTMSEAREAFLNTAQSSPRIDVILRNADSIARLICEMGRKLDPVPVSPTSP